jgi:hypothetical protein
VAKLWCRECGGSVKEHRIELVERQYCYYMICEKCDDKWNLIHQEPYIYKDMDGKEIPISEVYILLFPNTQWMTLY